MVSTLALIVSYAILSSFDQFCCHPCYAAARRAFSDALAEGRLEGILVPKFELDTEVYNKLQRRYANG